MSESTPKPQSYLRILAAIFLSVVLVTLLPNNHDRVLHQHLIQEIPKLSETLGNGPWAVAPGSDFALTSAFDETSKRRPTTPQTDVLITFSGQQTDAGYHLRATRGMSDDQETRIVPVTAWSLLPPLTAILVAIISGRLILGLSLAILAGGVLTSWHLPIHQIPITALYKAVVTYIWIPLQSSFQLYILAFTAGLIGMVRVTTIAGGNQGIADLLVKRAQGARSTRLAAFLMGMAIFFDDYANTIVVGSTLRPITDRFRVSREKLAYIVDSTAAPVAGIAIISTWIGYEVSLFEDLMSNLNTGLSGYQLFFSALPMRFYCWLTLFFVGFSAYFQRDFGPMLTAELRAQTTGQVIRPGATPLTGKAHDNLQPIEGITPVWWVAVFPVAIVIFGVISGMVIDTWHNADVQTLRQSVGFWGSDYWTACFSNADTAKVLFISAMTGSALAILIAMTRRHKQTGKRLISPQKAATAWIGGIIGVWYAIAILILAWAIKEVCTDAGTSTYLTAALSPIISPILLPMLIFTLASLVSFSIGTSWTTMAILIPTVVPLAHALGGLPLTILAAAAVLDGAIFGDHCSPISDTTVMSSISSSCDHLDHVKTQMPYAVTTMVIAAFFGYLGTAALYPGSVGMILGVCSIAAILLIFGRNPDIPIKE